MREKNTRDCERMREKKRGNDERGNDKRQER